MKAVLLTSSRKTAKERSVNKLPGFGEVLRQAAWLMIDNVQNPKTWNDMAFYIINHHSAIIYHQLEKSS
jgi:hypothetical protein